jgi:glycine cleavage system transcriptional repressor
VTLFAVNAIGADRPGIVAAVTGVLVELGCNLEDSSMSILRGHFAMVLIVAAPGGLAGSTLEEALVSGTASLDLVVSVRPVHDEVGNESGDDGAERWTIVVYGADHPGIVHGVTRRLAELDVNVVDLTTRVTGSDPPIYAMVMEVTKPASLQPEVLDRSLAEVAAGLGVTCTLHPSDADIL